MTRISPETLHDAIIDIMTYAKEEKKRNFLETIELQVGLKNLDLQKDKRFSGSVRLPYAPKLSFKICVIGNQKHCDEAKENGIDFLNENDLKKMNKNKKDVKKLCRRYNAFLASPDLIKKIPRLLGPGMMRAGKFPVALGTEPMMDQVATSVATIKFQLKKVMCLGVAVGNINMSEDELTANIQLAINFLASLLKKNWQNIQRIFIKSTMGKPHRIYGF